MVKNTSVIVYIVTAISLIDCVPVRRKRFLLQRNTVTQGAPFPTPTTYPVPTLPRWQPTDRSVITAKPNVPRTVLSGASLLNSVHVQCPVKRSSDIQRVILDDDHMRALHYELVGEVDRDLVSGDIVEAEANFKHMLPTLKKTSGRPTELSYGNNRATLMKDIRTFNDWLDSVNDVSDSTSLPWQQDNKTESLSKILDQVGITQEELKVILQLTHDIEEIKQYRYHGNNRIKRNTNGSTSRVEYCTERGTANDLGLLHMCTTCALTTQLPDNVFPRYINEAACDQSDCDCFTMAGTSHGRCLPVIRNIKMLRRQTNGCRMLINNGTQLFIDDWTLYDQKVRVGCECVFKRNSYLAAYIGKPKTP